MRCSRSRQVSIACVQASCALRGLGRRARRRRQPVQEIVSKSSEGHLQPLDARPGLIKEMIDSDTVHPRRECGVASERRQSGDHCDQDLLGCIVGVWGRAAMRKARR